MLRNQPVTDKEEVKMTLVSSFTNGRCTSLREMSDGEYEAMCMSLERSERDGRVSRQTEKKRWRHVCLTLMKEAGVNTNSWDAVNSYCMSPKIAGKNFGSLNEEELKELSVKLRAIVKKRETVCKL